jgi:hypothetical protein
LQPPKRKKRKEKKREKKPHGTLPINWLQRKDESFGSFLISRPRLDWGMMQCEDDRPTRVRCKEMLVSCQNCMQTWNKIPRGFVMRVRLRARQADVGETRIQDSISNS